jgi:hypothetical protein
MPTTVSVFGHSIRTPNMTASPAGVFQRETAKEEFRIKIEGPFHRKGDVTDVLGPKCNEYPGTLIPQEGLVFLHCAERRF